MYKKVNIHNGKYAISTDGVVYNTSTGKAMRGTTITKNNRYVKVHLDKFYALHLLVLETFVGERPEGYTANHKDGNRYNNALSNLEWVTHSDNVRHSRKTLLHRGQYGEEVGTSKLSLEQARLVWGLRDSDLTSRQIRDRYKLPVSIKAISNIREGKTWQRAIQGNIPTQCKPTPERSKLPPHNSVLTEEDKKELREHAHLLRTHQGNKGLSTKQLLQKLGLTHIKSGTAYAYIREYRLSCND